MTRSSRYLLVAVSAAIGLCVGLGAWHLTSRTWDALRTQESSPGARVTESVEMPVAAPLERRPDFTLPDLDGTPRSISLWDGRALVINFWASWCVPCLHEIPFFIDLQRKYADRGLQFIGIAIDHPENARRAYEQLGMNYPSLHGQDDALELSRRLGNQIGGLPFTVLIDREGKIVASKTGPFEQDEAEQAVLRVL
jgi:thiol-disulfide isomerase/thioredoxin